MRIGRSTLYEWVGRVLCGNRRQPVAQRLSDRPQPGRPAERGPRLKERVQALMDHKPARYGCRYAGWTTGTMNIQSDHLLLETVARWKGESLRSHPLQVRRAWRGWRIVLLLDRASGHEATASRQLACRLGGELRRLPTTCPELKSAGGAVAVAEGQRPVQPPAAAVQRDRPAGPLGAGRAGPAGHPADFRSVVRQLLVGYLVLSLLVPNFSLDSSPASNPASRCPPG